MMAHEAKICRTLQTITCENLPKLYLPGRMMIEKVCKIYKSVPGVSQDENVEHEKKRCDEGIDGSDIQRWCNLDTIDEG